MIFFNTALNFNLFVVGITVAAIGILGSVAFFNNPRSSTNRAFLVLAIFTVAYSVVNYVSYQLGDPAWTLWFLRLTIFFSVWHAFSFFHFSYVFPKESAAYPPLYKWLLVPIVALVSLLTLSPLMFAGIEKQAGAGASSQAILGPAIALFGIMAFGLVIGALFFLIKRTLKAQGLEKKQFIFILGGAVLTFLLLIMGSLILPLVFQDVRYVPLAALFFFPFIAFTTYAIMKHHLWDVKVISTEILAFALTVIIFSEIIFSASIAETLFRSGEFILVLIFSILLIKSVLREVQQREELARLNEKIESTNRELEQLSRFKSELLSLASHQIRSPLAAIKGFASLIADGTYGVIDARAKGAILKVEHSADELIGLINTLLDIRKVEEGKMDYKFEPTRMDVMVHDVVELLRPLAEQKHLEFTFTSSGAPLFANADAEKLKQVIQNLVDNAVKYTPAGFVHVSLANTDGKIIVTVADSGLGVPAILLPYLFEEFVRDERVKKQIRGTGLGLYIARKIAEAHGGTILATSPGEGKGSTFLVSLPLVPTPPQSQ